MSTLQDALGRVVADLEALDRRLALVGGLAVSVRAEPRFTRDVDLAVVVTDDDDAEALSRELQARGYQVLAVVEQKAQGRLATVRLQTPSRPPRGVVTDLLFASSGIETEIVEAAEPIQIFPDVMIPVAQTGHLLALKVLARDDRRRPQDLVDIRTLLAIARDTDIAMARSAVELIERRGFARGRDLRRLLEDVLTA
ncbi:nucleotidyl transferase AbiEii/AbiGii toxin family protein [Sorangium sp. So ce1151]|uniref:nucleotidyl transferase AbiEii/AbiGii toxin family protein n=1 Tax=Sorangium sp. So ce1151 TaxID=3133332 RepID=UPI003F5EE766